MSTKGIHMAVAELLSFSRAFPNRRLISSCRRGITPHGSCRITALMAPLLLYSLKVSPGVLNSDDWREIKVGHIVFKFLSDNFSAASRRCNVANVGDLDTARTGLKCRL